MELSRGFRDGRAPRRATVGQAAACGARLGADATGQQGPWAAHPWHVGYFSALRCVSNDLITFRSCADTLRSNLEALATLLGRLGRCGSGSYAKAELPMEV